MTAKGKTNASNVTTNDRIIVNTDSGAYEIRPSATKTGESVVIVRVLDKLKAANRRGYLIVTSVGSFYAEPIQTMWLAPEDNAGIKRAYAEALAEESYRESEATLAAQAAEVQSAVQAMADRGAAVSSPTRETTGSAVVRLLERVYSRIREDHVDLPELIIVTGSGADATGQRWGHFRPGGWMTKAAPVADHEGAVTSARLDEMFMAGETLAKGAAQVLQTMLHESAHTLARVRSIQDTSRQGRWHNARFLSLAGEMGLEYRADKADKALGYSSVVLTDKTRERYCDLLEELDREIHLMVNLPIWLGGDAGEDGGEGVSKPRGQGGSSTNNVKLTCLCEEPNIIRASRKVAQKQVVRCDDCDASFRDRS